MVPMPLEHNRTKDMMPTVVQNTAQASTPPDKAVDDIHKWVLFKRSGGDVYAIGSISVDRYLIVPEGLVDVTMRVIRYLDGSHDLTWIQRQILREFGANVDVAALFQKLLRSGLISTAQARDERPYSEVLRHSIRLLTVRVDSLFSRIRPLQILVSPYGLIVAAMLVIGAVNALFRTGSLVNLGALREAEYFWVWAGLLLFALVHEAFHGLVGLRYGLVPRSITVALYLGFIPYVYIRIPGIYTISARHRLLLWSAGMYANVLIGAVLLLIYPHLARHPVAAAVSVRLSLVNAGILIFNLSPFMATDTYFILSTLFKTPNIRTDAYDQLRKWAKGARNSFGPLVAGYFLVAAGAVLYGAARFFTWFHGLLLFIWRTRDLSSSLHRALPLLIVALLLAVRSLWGHKKRDL